MLTKLMDAIRSRRRGDDGLTDAERREYADGYLKREGSPFLDYAYRPHPLGAVTYTVACTCPDPTTATTGPRPPCYAHAQVWNGGSTTNTIGVPA